MEDLSFEGEYGLNDSFRSDSDPPYPQPSVLAHSFISNSPTLHPFPALASPSLRLCHLPAIHISSETQGLLGKLERMTTLLHVYEQEIERLQLLQPAEREVEAELKSARARLEQDEVQMRGMRGEIEALQRTVEGLRAAGEGEDTRQLRALNQQLKAEIQKRDQEIASFQGSETRMMSIDELKRLRQSLNEKNKKLASLERLLPADSFKPSNLFAFLSSPEASPWTAICAAIGEMTTAAEEKRDQELAISLDKLVTLLENEGLQASSAAEMLAETCIRLSRALNTVRVPWEQVKDALAKARDVCVSEVQRLGRLDPPQLTALVRESEEYLSDFSDGDYSVEIDEEEAAGETVKKLQSAVRKFQFSHSGPISPLSLFQLLRLRVLEANERGIEAFIRRLPLTNNSIQFESLIRDLQSRPLQWWLKLLASASFDLQHQVKAGTFVHLPTWEDWVQARLVGKVQRFLAQERLTSSDFSAQVCHSAHLTKREFRKRLLELRVPLNREDCHSLFRLVDEGEGFVSAAALEKLLETEETAPIAQERREGSKELVGLSERDARFRLLQAEQKIADLERNRVSLNPHLTKEHTLSIEVNTLKKDFEMVSAQLEDARREMRNLQFENDSLKSHLSTPREPEFRLESSLSAEVAALNSQVQSLSLEKDHLITEMRRKHEDDKAGLMRLVKSKNRELEALGGQVDRLLRDLQDLRT